MSRSRLLVALLALLLSLEGAAAQSPPLGLSTNAQPVFEAKGLDTALVTCATLAACTAATYNSATQFNFSGRGVYCAFNQTSHSGSPSTTFTVQAFEAATSSFLTLATSSPAVTNTDATTGVTQSSVAVYPGIATSGPTGFTGVSLPLPLQYRVQLIVAGTSGPAITGKVGCVELP